MPCARLTKTPRELWQFMFPDDPTVPISVGFQPGALFAVRKETIKQYSKHIYPSLHDEFFTGEMYHVNPETGHYLERFWLAMWKPEEYAVWSEGDVAEVERNGQGQLARGRWHVTPQEVEVDEMTVLRGVVQCVLFLLMVMLIHADPWVGCLRRRRRRTKM